MIKMHYTKNIYLTIIIPPPNKVGGGVYWIHLVRPSICPSVCLETTWFPEHKSSLLWNFYFKFHKHVDGGHRQKPIDFQRYHYKNVRLAAILEFWGFQTLTLVWLWISTSNFSGTILMYMSRSLLIFSNVIFKMAAWWPYWIFLFLDSVGGMVSGVLVKFALEFQFQTSYACWWWS